MAFFVKFCCGKPTDRKEKGNKGWRTFSLKELHAATNNFNYDNKLGEGGFGSVYWGQLWDGSQIAVKRLKVWSNNADLEFAIEVEILGRVRHKNLLSLRGYCAEGQERLIVYDYMPNLSLLSHLHGQHSEDCLLDWGRRMKIAIGSAEGIVYLHHHATPHIIHRDIKASNVLLDSDFQAQVADFGFAKLIPDGATHVTTRVKGTLGYLAPEYAMFGKASESCDVYSFGILLLELCSGRKPIEKISPTMKRPITDWALPLAREKKFDEMADPKLNGKYVEEELKRVLLVALTCSQNSPEKRPTMLEVVDLLKGESKEKLANMEESELFRSDLAGDDQEGLSGADDSSDFISDVSSKTMALGSYQSQASDNIHRDVLSEARNSCYKARDSFYACLDKESSKKPTEIASVGLLYPVECKKSRESFEKLCRPTWVKHFDRQYCAKKRVHRLLDTDESRRGPMSLPQPSTFKP